MHVLIWQQAYDGADARRPPRPSSTTRPSPSGGAKRLAGELPGRTWVARDAERPRGRTPPAAPGRDEDRPVELERYAIILLDRTQGTGLGDARWSSRSATEPAYLWVLDGNDGPWAFYRRHGFVDEGGRKPEPDTGNLAVRMVRQPRANAPQ